MNNKLKNLRKDIRYYHRQLTKNIDRLSWLQKEYLLSSFAKAQQEHRLSTGKCYEQYYLPRPININSTWIV